MYEIGERILRIRTLRGVTQTEGASILDVTQNTFSQKENGKSSFSAEEIQLLCKVWAVDIRYVFGEITLDAADRRRPRPDLDQLRENAQLLPPTKQAELLAFSKYLLSSGSADSGTGSEPPQSL